MCSSDLPQIYSKLEEAQDITDEIEDLLKKALEAYGEEFKDTIK